MTGGTPFELAFLKDLGRSRTIDVRCRRCGHRGSVSTRRILRSYQELMPLVFLQPKLRCIECGTKGEVEIDAREALADSHRP